MKLCPPAQKTSPIFRLSGVEVVKIRTDLPKISVFLGNLSVDLGTSTCGKTIHPDRPVAIARGDASSGDLFPGLLEANQAVTTMAHDAGIDPENFAKLA